MEKDLNELLHDLKNSLDNYHKEASKEKAILSRYEKIIRDLENRDVCNEKSISILKRENARLIEEIDGLNYSLNLYQNSLSWKFTRPLRYMGILARKIKKILVLLGENPSLINKGIKSFHRYGFKHSFNKISSMISDTYYAVSSQATFDLLNQDKIYILTTKHCFFIATLIKENLAKLDIKAEIIYEKPKDGFGNGLHFVICAQMFDELPDTYIAYQLEQSVSSRWFTKEYINKLENSYAILDYSLDNIEFLQSKGLYYQQMYFLPIGYNQAYEKSNNNNIDEEYDVLFYGDINNDRRKKYLNELKKYFKVKVVSEVFGKELYDEIRKAKIIVNIHYYDGALLETTRLFECLSLGKMIVSEKSSDIDKHTTLQKCIDFVDVNDISGMKDRISYWLNNPDLCKSRVQENIHILNSDANWFEFYFMRFMLANDWISFEKFYSLVGKNIQFSTDFVCLGLPESIARSKDFDKDNKYNIEKFPGLRHKKGWIGCGLSYKFIFKKAQEQNFTDIIVCEDDVEFKDGFIEDLSIIRSYLSKNKDWDLFSGVIADLSKNVNITKLEKTKSGEYIYLDKMTSMVLNIYSNRFFDKIVSWNENDHDVNSNAIDRYIENSSNISTITRIPYLVGHKEDLDSTLWGFKNNVYSEMIKNSEKELGDKVKRYKETEI